MTYEVTTLTLEDDNNSNLIQIILDNENNCEIEFDDIKLDLDELKNIVKQAEIFMNNYIYTNKYIYMKIDFNNKNIPSKVKAIQFTGKLDLVKQIEKEYELTYCHLENKGNKLVICKNKNIHNVKINNWIIQTNDKSELIIYSNKKFKKLYKSIKDF